MAMRELNALFYTLYQHCLGGRNTLVFLPPKLFILAGEMYCFGAENCLGGRNTHLNSAFWWGKCTVLAPKTV